MQNLQKILAISPSLIANEIEFCVLLRLNFETKEIVRYLDLSVRGVEAKKYRIRRKLCILSTVDIVNWITSI
jgi:DNA-binding CsgD family transcriptional regulator